MSARATYGQTRPRSHTANASRTPVARGLGPASQAATRKRIPVGIIVQKEPRRSSVRMSQAFAAAVRFSVSVTSESTM